MYTVAAMAKKWNFPSHDPAAVEHLAARLRVSPVTSRILLNRGLRDAATAQRFLQPSLHDLVDPCEDANMVAAVRFLLEAAGAGRPIAIFGDYDADGVCATALLQRTFRFLGTDARVYIPHRIDEGYGLSGDALRELAGAGVQVVVSVDCGVSAVEEVALARSLGMDIVVTDHHEPGDGRPEPTYLLNPKLDGACFGYEYLAGVGVAFKLAWTLGQQLSEGDRVSEAYRDLLMENLALVAIGTVADVVPLLDENRILVRYGLRTIRATNRPGLNALLGAARLVRTQVTATDIAFRVAPLLNAAGRMGEPGGACELLTTDDPARARELAAHLLEQNRLRRNVQRSTYEQAAALADVDDRLAEQACIVLTDPNWHQGVLGLVASRLAETFCRPAFVFSVDGDTARGSARSVPQFPLFTAVGRCADLLDRFGGHESAAGLSLPLANLPAFEERINAVAAELLAGETPEPELDLDGQTQLDELNIELVRELDLLAPFGKDNRGPVFAAFGLRLAGNPQLVGSDRRHLAFMVRQNDTTLRVFAPRRADWLEPLRDRKGQPFSLAFEPTVNRFGGAADVELRAEDMRWGAEADPAA
jgi:single-stranded-DNA-specific exonuclease